MVAKSPDHEGASSLGTGGFKNTAQSSSFIFMGSMSFLYSVCHPGTYIMNTLWLSHINAFMSVKQSMVTITAECSRCVMCCFTDCARWRSLCFISFTTSTLRSTGKLKYNAEAVVSEMNFGRHNVNSCIFRREEDDMDVDSYGEDSMVCGPLWVVSPSSRYRSKKRSSLESLFPTPKTHEGDMPKGLTFARGGETRGMANYQRGL